MRDTKSTWKLINNILKPNSKRVDFKLEEVGGFVDEPVAVSGVFNEYFSNVATELKSSIPTVAGDPLQFVQRIQNSFVFFETNHSEVDRVICSFPSKGSSISLIPSFIFKSISSIISPILSYLINSAVNEGFFPDFMKIARVVPIHKSGSKKLKSNFRPISTLLFISCLLYTSDAADE